MVMAPDNLQSHVDLITPRVRVVLREPHKEPQARGYDARGGNAFRLPEHLNPASSASIPRTNTKGACSYVMGVKCGKETWAPRKHNVEEYRERWRLGASFVRVK
jgi:hypothetical protein